MFPGSARQGLPLGIPVGSCRSFINRGQQGTEQANTSCRSRSSLSGHTVGHTKNTHGTTIQNTTNIPQCNNHRFQSSFTALAVPSCSSRRRACQRRMEHSTASQSVATTLQQPLLQRPCYSTLPAARAKKALLAAFASSALLVALCFYPALWEQRADTISRTSFGTVTSAQSKLTILVEGVPHEYLIVALNQTPATLVRASGHTLSLTRGNTPAAVGTRLWLARDPSLGADSYVQLSLLGKSLSYSLDLSGVGCSCNAALYWVSMPGYDKYGHTAPGGFGNYCAQTGLDHSASLGVLAHPCCPPGCLTR